MSGSLKIQDTPQKAVFAFEDYKFTNVSISMGELSDNESLGVDFIPSGVYDSNTGLFKLKLNFVAVADSSKNTVIAVECVALFRFGKVLDIDQLPDYFYANSTAILYPYIRAFVSTITLQANYTALVLPTLNVASLGERLKSNTISETVSEKIG